MNRSIVFLLIIFGTTGVGGAIAQTALVAMPCDLVHDPNRFANQIVRVRATVSIAFEDFTLETPDCNEEKDVRPVWLVYGGDEPTPTASTVNDTSRPSGMVLKVNGRPITLHRDAALDLFVRRLAAVRTTDVMGGGCYDNCRLYIVTATLTGVFFAVPKGVLGGYGHLGCCHLLAIQEVSDVSARRTPVPAGGRFVCSTETWNIGEVEAETIAAKRGQCAGFSACRRAEFNKIAAVAEHWGDHIIPSDDDHLILFPDLVWRSADLSTTYTLKTASKDSMRVTGTSAMRTVCKAVLPPMSQDTPVGCRTLDSVFAKAAKDTATADGANGRRLQVASTEQAANQAMKDATARWSLTANSDLLFAGCGKPMIVGGDKFSWCDWKDPEGMQSFTVQITKFGALRHGHNWESVPWALSRGYGLACAAE